ncbi:MAG: extracellular solute-binding protein, partial [Treponema sp.]|nr:extracellular solute-binding protein [Treponema sp.]
TVVLLFSIPFLFSCNRQQASGTGARTADTEGYSDIVTPPGEFPVVKAPYTLKVFAAQPPNIEDFATNEFTLAYEKRTGVHIEWEIAPANTVAEKLNMSLVGGQYADMYLQTGMSKQTELLYGSQGVFIPLNGLIEKYAPNLSAVFKEYPDFKTMCTAPDGNIYSMPVIATWWNMMYPAKLWINSTWLKNLNLKVPTTTEEFYQVLKAFKERDPNGNGSGKQVIPFFAADNTRSNFVEFFMNSFIPCNLGSQGFMYVTDDDKVHVAFDKPEWREGLRYIRRLVSEGLIDASSFSATQDQLKRIFENPGDMIMGATVWNAPSGFMDLNGSKHKNYDTIAPLAGPKGVRLAVYRPDAMVITGATVITKALKNPEVAVRWLDYFYSLEGDLEMRIGREGIEWRRAKPGELSYSGLPAEWAKLTAIGGSQNIFWSQYGLGQYVRHDRQASAPDIYSVEGLETRLYQATQSNYMPYKPQKVLPALYFSPAIMKKINQPLNDVRDYVQEYIVRFSTGELDLDKDWDSYLSNFKRMGLDDIIAAYQDAYDAYLKNQQQ